MLVSLLALVAENACVLGDTKTALDYITLGRNTIGRSSMAVSKLGARMNFVTAQAQYQLGHMPLGDTALAAAMSFQQKGSLWGFHINLTDVSRQNKAAPLSARVAMDAYTKLRDRTAYPRDEIEMALAHAIRDKTEAAYRRGDALDKRRRLITEWARYCEMPAISGSVVHLRGA